MWFSPGECKFFSIVQTEHRGHVLGKVRTGVDLMLRSVNAADAHVEEQCMGWLSLKATSSCREDLGHSQGQSQMLGSPQPCCLYLSLIICPPLSPTCRVLTELVSKMKDMQMDKSELGCLRAIVLFNPGKSEAWSSSR